MAGLQIRGGHYRIHFRYQGKQHFFSLGNVSKSEAEAKVSQVDYLLMRMKQRLVTLPSGVDIVQYLKFDGKAESPQPSKFTLAQLRDQYLSTHAESLESNTLSTARMHFRHLTACFGEGFPVTEITLADLQQYVEKRSKAQGTRGRKLSTTTLKKEIVTLRIAWNWGLKMKKVTGPFPSDGLRFPKATEKPSFQTFDEIERRIKRGATEAEIADLFEVLYLQLHEMNELLDHVKQKAAHLFIYPMFCCAAHTGARRSELIRMKVTDVDFEAKTLTVYEKKRVRGTTTTRRIPLSTFLIDVLKDWLAQHPGGPWLFCHQTTIPRSRKRSPETGHRGVKTRPTTNAERKALVQKREPIPFSALTIDETNHHFRKTLANSKWEVIRGWHTLRHSFVSACVSRGVDQRLVESWAGHMSPEMSRRYSHLYPSAQQQAMASVFDTQRK